MRTLTTITGREIKVSSNKQKRTFTIITDSGKFRTNMMSIEEFNNCEYYTGNDWNNFLKSDTYFKIK
jgi:hypothetical protein